MAQYRLSAGVISRSDGKSIVAAAAYRSANKLLDERTGDIKDYSRRHRSVLYTQILTPENAPEWMHDRQRLWNGVEHREDRSTKRGTAQLARDIELSLPYELTHEQRVDLVCEFVKAEFVDRGMVADIAKLASWAWQCSRWVWQCSWAWQSPWSGLFSRFRQLAWLLTACKPPLPLTASLRKLWRFAAREFTTPLIHPAKRRRKAKAPRPF
jgi:hypothetical protein